MLSSLTKSIRAAAIVALLPLSLSQAAETITEFSPEQNKQLKWRIVNDGVMGGLSKGKVSFSKEGTMKFQGTLSLENNGGFSSVRSTDLDLDLSSNKGLAMRVKGDGRTYQVRLSTDARYRSSEVGFRAEFPTAKGKWTTVSVPFGSLVPSWRGRELDNEFDASNIKRLTFLLGDKKPGPFKLEVDWVRTYKSGEEIAASDSSDIVETALSDGRFKTLATALTEADLVSVLQGEGPFTVFAPTDEAFAKLPEGTVAELLKESNREKLQAILKYHVLAGEATLSGALKAADVATVQGDSVEIGFSEGRVRVNEAALVNADIQCANGIIHVIDSVLLPPKPKQKNILETAEAAGSFSSLLAALEFTGLASMLNGEGPFTVFAPTDAAVSALPEDTEELLKEENRDQLKAILTYHVVPGKVTAGDALNAGTATTVNGQPITVALKDGTLKVNGATLRTVDLQCTNGVIHVIDGVLLPETKQAEPKQAKTPTPEQRILVAIDKGVPLYNKGNPGACADVYQDCMESIVKDSKVDSDIREKLADVLNKAQMTKSSDSRAWLLRRNLDGALAYFMQSGR